MRSVLLVAICSLWVAGEVRAEFRAGAAAVDVTPRELPVIQNGGFIERQVRLVADPLSARALVLQGEETIAIVVVDSCMMDREFCDRVKAEAEAKSGIPRDKILLSATHTHSAPSVMDYCLGSRRDPKYSEFLPGKIVEAIVEAKAALRPAEAAWARFDAGDYTKTRRWAFRTGTERTDPFGERTVRANMHPGHQNPDAVGETGPPDPWFTLLGVRDSEGKPLAVLGNFSMHYFSGHAGISADYFGHYVRGLAAKLAPGDRRFVAILSQGTSGDLWRGDYSKPKPAQGISIEDYAARLVELSVGALEPVAYRKKIPVSMVERRIEIGRRVPDEDRLAWARDVIEKMGNRRPETRPEVYAEQAIYLHQNPRAEVVLQSVRIGEMGITAMPNEVYGLTGLKLKYRSPLELTMNIELANGASGYIPPPEQYPLGGYNTWPARTAGLAVDAETRIVETNLKLLEQLAGKPRRRYREPATPYARAVLKSKPRAFWRLGDLDGKRPLDAAAGQWPAQFESGVVFHLPGPGDSRCAHFAGGRVAARVPESLDGYSVAFWFWNGVRHDRRAVTGYLFSRGPDGDPRAAGEHLGIGGTHSHGGRLIVYNGNEKQALLAGRRELGVKRWHHVAMVRNGEEIIVYLDGREEIRGGLEMTHGGSTEVFFGGRSDNFSNLEGRLDELAFYDRTLSGREVRDLYAASAPMDSAPSTPEQTLKKTHVREGYVLELVAAEPLVRDPVAIDWSADGNLFVAEMADYPYGVEGGGRVARLSDSDGDGEFDRREDFLSGLSFPAGVMAWGNGVIVTAAPDILYAEDRDGDGVAEHVERWFSGFVEGNQQLRVNGLRIGLDGWIYCASGGHHAGFGTGTVVTSHKTGEEIAIGSRDFRFRPDGRIEPESGPSQFGRVRDDVGNWFGVQNAHPLWHYVLPERYLRRNPDAPAPDPRNQLRDRMPQLFPAKETQKRFHGFDHVGRYTSACGISIYRDDLLFPRVDGQAIAFTCAPFHNVVQRHVLKPGGVSFSAERAGDGEFDFFASRDRWCRPVMSRTAPDGSLWIVDMYRYMIEHPDWLPPVGKDELRPHYRAGEDLGRIYRIYPEGRKPKPFFRLDPELPLGENGVIDDLVLRAGEDLRARLRTSSSPVMALALGGEPERHLSDPSPGVRALALRMLESDPEPPAAVYNLASDPSPQVRLQLAFSLGEWRTQEAANCLLELALSDGADHFMRAAILSSAKPHFGVLFSGLVDSEVANEDLVGTLLKMARAEIAIPLLSRADDPSSAQLRSASEWLLRNRESAARFGPLMAVADAMLRDRNETLNRRVAALPLVVERTKKFPALAVPHPDLIRAAIIACCRRDLASEVLARWRTLSPAQRVLAIDQASGSLENIGALMGAIGDPIDPSEFAAAQRQRLLESKNAKVRSQARKHFGVTRSDRVELISSYRSALEGEGNPERGRVHFRAACAACHQLEGVGTAVGPDLLSITNRARPALLTAILDPSRNVEPRYLGYVAEGAKSTLAAGMVSAETATSVIFKLLDGSEQAVARTEMVSLKSLGRSFMPEGLEATLDQEAMTDLLSYLESVFTSHR